MRVTPDRRQCARVCADPDEGAGDTRGRRSGTRRLQIPPDQVIGRGGELPIDEWDAAMPELRDLFHEFSRDSRDKCRVGPSIGTFCAVADTAQLVPLYAGPSGASSAVSTSRKSSKPRPWDSRGHRGALGAASRHSSNSTGVTPGSGSPGIGARCRARSSVLRTTTRTPATRSVDQESA